MKTVYIDGVIGWDVLAADVRKELTGKEEIDLAISSPGGSVFEGLSIFNAIRDFRRKGGKVNARIIGMAASMATYIPLAADTVSIEDNAIFMIHNSWSMAIGNKKEMNKQAEILAGIDSLLNKEYAKKSGRDDIENLMNEETYLYGQEIIDFGFADSMEKAGDGANDKKEAVAVAKNAMSEMFSKMSAEPEKQNLGKAAAMIKEIKGEILKTPAASRENKPAPEAEKKGVPKMETLQELKKEAPELYAEAVEKGKEEGIKAERERRNSIKEFAKIDPENEGLQNLCNEAIESGAVNDSLFGAKVSSLFSLSAKLEGENAPTVETVLGQNTSLTEEELALCENFDLTKEEFIAQKKEA